MADSPRSIAFVLPDLPVGGAEHQILQLASGLNRQAFAPFVVVLRRNGALEPAFRAAGVEVVCVVRAGRWDLSPIFRLTALFRRRSTTAVVGLLAPATLFALIAARLAGVPTRIAAERGTAYASARWSHHVYTILESAALRDATLVVANSEAGRRFAVERGVPPARTRVIYNGLRPLVGASRSVDAIRSEVGADAADKLIGTVASLTVKKDPATLLRAAERVLAREPAARFVWVGDGPMRRMATGLAEALGIAERVAFVGERHDVADWLRAFDLAVLSSVEREGCSNFLMESQASGLPVVATAVGGNAEVVSHGETGLIVPAADPVGMAEAILTLLENRSCAERMARNARSRVSTLFDPAAHVAEWESVLGGNH